jgi:hypothetical protein
LKTITNKKLAARAIEPVLENQISRASLEYQNGQFSLIHERRLKETKLEKQVCRRAAMNPCSRDNYYGCAPSPLGADSCRPDSLTCCCF